MKIRRVSAYVVSSFLVSLGILGLSSEFSEAKLSPTNVYGLGLAALILASGVFTCVATWFHVRLVSADVAGGALACLGIVGLLIEFSEGKPSPTNFPGYTLAALLIVCGVLTCAATRSHYGGGLWSFCGLTFVAAAIARSALALQMEMQGRQLLFPVSFYSSVAALWGLGCYCLIWGHIRRRRGNGRMAANRAFRIIPLVLVVFASQIMAGETNIFTSYERGVANIKSDEWKEAISNFTDAIHRNPKDALAYEYRGGAYIITGDFDSAINDFTQAIQLDSTNSRAYCNRGSVYRGKREFDKAIADLNKSLSLNPTNDAAYKTRAAIHGSKGEWKEAVNDWDQGLRLNPNDPLNTLALASRGWAHFMTSQFDKALHDYRDALQINPTNDSALNNLAWLRATCPSAEMRNGKEAVELATKACELTNWNKWDWIDTLAAALAEAGDFKSAIKYEKQAMDMSSVTEPYRKEMQRCLSLYGQQKPNHEGQKQ